MQSEGRGLCARKIKATNRNRCIVCTKQGPRTQVKRGPGMNFSAMVILEVTQRTMEFSPWWDLRG